MTKSLLSAILFVLLPTVLFSQVGINTTSPTETLDVNGTLRIRQTDIGSTVSAKDSLLVVDGNGVLKRTNSSEILNQAKARTIVLNREDAVALSTANNTFYNLPLGTAHVQITDSAFFTVIGNGKIKVLQSGVYLISGELSLTNMPSGGRKFILGLFVNGIRRAYLSRGYASLSSTDYWGTTGFVMYSLNANDVIDVRYVLNNGGTTLNSNFLNIGVTKL